MNWTRMLPFCNIPASRRTGWVRPPSSISREPRDAERNYGRLTVPLHGEIFVNLFTSGRGKNSCPGLAETRGPTVRPARNPSSAPNSRKINESGIHTHPLRIRDFEGAVTAYAGPGWRRGSIEAYWSSVSEGAAME